MKRKSLPLLDIGVDQLPKLTASGWKGWGELFRDLRLKPKQFLQFAVVGARIDLLEFFRSEECPRGAIPLASFDRAMHVRYERSVGKKTFSGEFLLLRTDYPSIFLLLTVSSRTYWRLALAPMVDSMYPRVAAPFLTQAELFSALRDLQKHKQEGGLRVLELSTRKRLKGESRKRLKSTREWTDEALETVFREARQTNQWFQSVSFELVSTDQEGRLHSTSSGVVSKYGYIACDDEAELYVGVVNTFIEMAANRFKFFSHRDRMSAPQAIPQPIHIDYDTEVLATPVDMKKLVTALKRFRHGSVSVLHANPYLHLSVVDNKDLSTADVWVLSSKQILLMPQVRTSEHALKRIVNHIFENFREGELRGKEQAA